MAARPVVDGFIRPTICVRLLLAAWARAIELVEAYRVYTDYVEALLLTRFFAPTTPPVFIAAPFLECKALVVLPLCILI